MPVGRLVSVICLFSGMAAAGSSVQVSAPAGAYEARTCSARLSPASVKVMAASLLLGVALTAMTTGAPGTPAGTATAVWSDMACVGGMQGVAHCVSIRHCTSKHSGFPAAHQALLDRASSVVKAKLSQRI